MRAYHRSRILTLLGCLIFVSAPSGLCAQVENLMQDDVRRTDDKIVQYDGNPGGYLSAEASFGHWTTHNRLAEVGTTLVHFDRDPTDGTSIRIHETAEGPHRVALVTVHEGGHWAAYPHPVSRQ